MQNATLDDYVKNHAVYAQDKIKLILAEFVDHVQLEGGDAKNAVAGIMSILTAMACRIGAEYFDKETFLSTMEFGYTRAMEMGGK